MGAFKRRFVWEAEYCGSGREEQILHCPGFLYEQAGAEHAIDSLVSETFCHLESYSSLHAN